MSDNWQELAPLDDLPEGKRRVFTFGKTQVLVLNLDSNIYAVDNRCPHMGFPLLNGRLEEGKEGECFLHCPFHRSAFNLETGDVAEWTPWPPGIGVMLGKLSPQSTLDVFETKIENNVVYVALDEEPTPTE